MRYTTTDDRLHRDISLRRQKVAALMRQGGIDAALFTHPANVFYLTGRVSDGYVHLDADGSCELFVRRPCDASGQGVTPIKHPSQIPALLKRAPASLALEDDVLPHAEFKLLAGLFPGARIVEGALLALNARAVKTPLEIETVAECGRRQANVFAAIPALYRPGMTDIQLCAEIERALRLAGHTGMFRTYGIRLEAHMGLVLAGKNALVPSPYDFSLGGEGMDGGFPEGARGEPLLPGTSVIVDFCFVHGGYQSDMTRAFFIGEPTREALHAHSVCLEIERAVADAARPGARCADLYALAAGIAAKAGYADRFMGLCQQAKFVGHSIGIEVNELPVLTPRTDAVIQSDMVFAVEPKIVLPGVGGVGVENTYHIGGDGARILTAGCADTLTAL